MTGGGVAAAFAPEALAAALGRPAVILALVLQVLDVATTVFGLRLPGVREENPGLRAAMARMGRAWPLVKLAVLPLLPMLAAGPSAVLWAVNAAMAAIVANNLVVIARARR